MSIDNSDQEEVVTRKVLERKRGGKRDWSRDVSPVRRRRDGEKESVDIDGQTPKVIADGMGQPLPNRICEAALVLAPLAFLVYQNALWADESVAVVVMQWAAIVTTVLLVRWNAWQFPQTMYLIAFPATLALVARRDALCLNMTLSLAALPLSWPLVQLLAASLAHADVALYLSAVEIHKDTADVIRQLAAGSLTDTEVSLFASAVVNLVYMPKSEPVRYVRAVIGACVAGVLAVSSDLEAVYSLGAIMGPHRRPPDAEQRKWALAKRVYLVFPPATVVAFVGLLYADGLSPESLVLYLLRPHHLYMLGYWLGVLAIVMPVVLALSSRWELDLRRKAWHFTIVAMFLPVGPSVDAGFTSLAMAVALALFLLLEIVRGIGLPPYGQLLHQVLSGYVDERDTCGPIIVSHIFLLLGIWLPIVLAASPAGILCLGLGDASASLIGRRFGRHKWFGKKTVEGTLAFTLAVACALALVAAYLPSYNLRLGWARTLAVAGSTGLLEATSGMNDNVIVPTYMLVVLRIAQVF